MLDRWSRKQYKTYKEFLNNKDGYNIKETKEALSITKKAWIEMYKVLFSYLSSNEMSRINLIRMITRNSTMYLHIRIVPNRNIFIDIRNMHSLNEEEVAKAFPTDISKYIGQGEFTIEELPDNISRQVFDTYIVNQIVYSKGPELRYELNNGKTTGYFIMDLATSNIALSFKEDKQVNYLFFNGTKLDGMTGDLDRKITTIINESITDIKIPAYIVKRYLTTAEDLKIKYQKEF